MLPVIEEEAAVMGSVISDLRLRTLRLLTTRSSPSESEDRALGALWEQLDPALPAPRARGPLAGAVKRAVDVAVASAALVVLAPLVGLLALAIRLDDGGPVLFGHMRVGRGGQRFRCWKLRTMRVSTDADLTDDTGKWIEYVRNDFKIATDDDRVTRSGRILRTTYLDELPQLWNVVRGELSLVGPRPVTEPELLWFGPYADEVLSVRPGLTGPWQLTAHVRQPERALLEIGYVRRANLAYDAWLLACTVVTVLTGRQRSMELRGVEGEVDGVDDADAALTGELA